MGRRRARVWARNAGRHGHHNANAAPSSAGPAWRFFPRFLTRNGASSQIATHKASLSQNATHSIEMAPGSGREPTSWRPPIAARLLILRGRRRVGLRSRMLLAFDNSLSVSQICSTFVLPKTKRQPVSELRRLPKSRGRSSAACRAKAGRAALGELDRHHRPDGGASGTETRRKPLESLVCGAGTTAGSLACQGREAGGGNGSGPDRGRARSPRRPPSQGPPGERGTGSLRNPLKTLDPGAATAPALLPLGLPSRPYTASASRSPMCSPPRASPRTRAETRQRPPSRCRRTR